jgi:hypothetical protein
VSPAELLLLIRSVYEPSGDRGRLVDEDEAGCLASAGVGFALENWDRLPSPGPVAQVLPGNGSFKEKTRPVDWQGTLAQAVCGALACRVEAVRASNALTVSGSAGLAPVAAFLCSSLIRDVEEYADRAYLKLFYSLRGRDGQGDVSGARGERARIIGRVTAALVKLVASSYSEAVTRHPGLVSALSAALPPATEAPTPEARVEARRETDPERAERIKRVVAATERVPEDVMTDGRLASVYESALTAAGLAKTTRAEGVAFDLRVKRFSVVEAMTRAAERLGGNPTSYCVLNAVLYLSTPVLRVQTDGWRLASTTESRLVEGVPT